MQESTGDESGFSNFTGDNTRVPADYEFPAFYVRNISMFQRSKYGWAQDVTCTVYFSPKQLEERFGTFRLDYSKLKVIINGEEMAIHKYNPLSEMFDTCLVVEIQLRDINRGAN